MTDNDNNSLAKRIAEQLNEQEKHQAEIDNNSKWKPQENQNDAWGGSKHV